VIIYKYDHSIGTMLRTMICILCLTLILSLLGGSTTTATTVPTSAPLLVGLSVECGGHGIHRDSTGECECFDDDTQGHWVLSHYSHVAAELVKVEGGGYVFQNVVHSRSECITCIVGYRLENGCLTGYLRPTTFPTNSPSSSPV